MHIPPSLHFTHSVPLHPLPVSTASDTLPLSIDNHVARLHWLFGLTLTAIKEAWSDGHGHHRHLGQAKSVVHYHGLTKRQSSQSTNIMIAIIVAILLSVFVAAVIAFLYRYSGSIRYEVRKKRRHKRKRRHDSDSATMTPIVTEPGSLQVPPDPEA